MAGNAATQIAELANEDHIAEHVVVVKWIEGLDFMGLDSSGHSIVMSASSPPKGSMPSELLLQSLAGCISADLVHILTKQRQDLRDLEIYISKVQDPQPPWTFRHIHLDFVFRGKGLKREHIERAIDLAENKYCSVGSTIKGIAEITHHYRIIEVD
ncbi:MAG: OsmC family protein [Chloroflexi bacterium]|nr:OsmC family protein [Chloroflexota bacterium]